MPTLTHTIIDSESPAVDFPLPSTSSSAPLARVLLIHHLNCQCGATYTYPAESLLYRYRAAPGAFDLRIGGSVIAGLPFEIKHLKDRRVLSCEKCFETFEGNNYELFPELSTRHFTAPLHHNHHKAPAPSKALSLSDF